MVLWKLIRPLVPIAMGLAIVAVIALTLGRTVGTWMMDRHEHDTAATGPGRMLDVDDVLVHVQERGAGPAVVLVHDAPGWSGDWPDEIVAPLAVGHRVIAIDLLGAGYSARPATVGITVWADQIVRVSKSLDAAPATIVGHGIGAIASLAAAAEDPSVARRLVLVAPTVPIPDDDRSWRSFLPLVPGAGELMAGWSVDLLRAPSMPPQIGVGSWLGIPGTRRCLLAALRDASLPSRPGRAMERVHVPTVVLHGIADDVAPWSAVRRWIPSIHGVVVRPVSDAGHWLPTERPDLVLETIIDTKETT